MSLKKLDDTLRICAALLFALMCLLSAAFAASEDASATDAESGSEPLYEYEVTITPPEGWSNTDADVLIEIKDINGTGFVSASAQRPGDSSWTDIKSGSSSVKISGNGTVRVRITDGNGELHEFSQDVECIDTTAPTVTAGIRDKVLHTEASDSQSGVYGVMVDDDLYTTLKNGELDLRIEDYANAEAKLDILAIDNVGNGSDVLTIDNPYYAPVTPTPAATATAKPTATPAPTATPTVTHDPVIIYTGTLESAQATAAPAQATVPTQSTQTTATVTTPSASASTPVSTTVTHPVQDTTADETEDAPTPAPTTEPEEITIEPGEGFSEPGNAVTRDLLYDKHTNKQFITVQTRNGNTMYLVIDYDKVSDADEEQYQTYFLNPVDEADLLALLDDDAITALTGSDVAEETPAVCTCTDKCAVGHIDTTCPVCRTDLSKCTGFETITPTPEPTPEAEEETEPEHEASGGKVGGVLAVLLIFGGIGGGLFYFLKNKKSKPQTAGSTDFDDYDFGEDEDDLNIPEEEESDERTSDDP